MRAASRLLAVPQHLGRRHLSSRAKEVLSALKIQISDDPIHGMFDGESWGGSGDILETRCPATGELLAKVQAPDWRESRHTIKRSVEAYKSFRFIPAPKRGEILRQIRDAIARKREALGALVSLEMGKIKTEGIGEVQEIIDICDYALGLSRMMNGRVINSERPGHTLLEGGLKTAEFLVEYTHPGGTVPNPLGVVGVLSAFNFPVAVYGWNLALSFIAGNATVWKPSPTTPLCAIAVTQIVSEVLKKNGVNGAVASLLCGAESTGGEVTGHKEVDMVSFTGSERVGKMVATVVQNRFGKVLLELGGNNAAVVMPDADMKMALQAVAFGAIGTAGQRCTSTRRLFLHRSIAVEFLESLQKFYASPSLLPGDPLEPKTLLGPVHSSAAIKNFQKALKDLTDLKSEIVTGGQPFHNSALPDTLQGGNYLQPTIVLPHVSLDPNHKLWATETFAPILKVAFFDDLEEAIAWNNAVPQGLSSTLWTRDLRNLGKWIGAGGSDCGIVNVNAGTSGAEIGAAFGGNKSTGWGRESGGDAWKQYVRWSACTINFSDEMPLAQGVDFNA